VLWLKLSLPSLMMALILVAPWNISALLGCHGRLRARTCRKHSTFCPSSPTALKTVSYLWLRAGAEPRAYDVEATKNMKEALLDAKTAMVRHGSAHISVSCAASGGKGSTKLGAGERSEAGEPVLAIDKNEAPKEAE